MYGLELVIQVVSLDIKVDSPMVAAHQHEIVLFILKLCIPNEQKQTVDQMLEVRESSAWLIDGFLMFFKLAMRTFLLAVGWAVHLLLV
jgi:hypothetical protein